MNWKQLNAALASFSTLRYSNKVATEKDEEGNSVEICKIAEDVYVKFTISDDSYGEERILGIQFVQPKQQTVTNYEPIK
jgi:hypothetical protein